MLPLRFTERPSTLDEWARVVLRLDNEIPPMELCRKLGDGVKKAAHSILCRSDPRSRPSLLRSNCRRQTTWIPRSNKRVWMRYNAHWGVYRLRLTSVDVKGKADVLRELMRLAYERRTA